VVEKDGHASSKKEVISLTEEEWIDWAKTTLNHDFTGAAERMYKQNAIVALSAVQNHAFFRGIDEFLADCEAKYESETGADLLMGGESIKLEQKSYNSAVNKAYRYNYVQNRKFPKEPNDGWQTPDNWFTKLNDIIRGTIVCKYIDAPNFLAERLHEYADAHSLKSEYVSQQRDEGYYAFHYYLKVPVDLMDRSLNAMPVSLQVEIQITTQLQEILYKITHRYFENTRNQKVADRIAWKWDVTSNKFKSGYLSHTLHLLEAIIVELRDSKMMNDETPSKESHNE
jgi:ppGpp synthetase/RelA/SpoT-type nucleotidyltranferase